MVDGGVLEGGVGWGWVLSWVGALQGYFRCGSVMTTPTNQPTPLLEAVW